VRANVVSDRYLETMGIALLRGRQFSPSDTPTSPSVAIISRSLAQRLWPGEDAIGKTIIATSGRFEVIGIVPDTVYVSAVERNPPPFLLVRLLQSYESGVTLHVRASGDPMALVPAVRQAVREEDPHLVLARPRRLSDEFDRSLSDQRMMATMVAIFAGIAMLLAAVGLYGVLAHLAAQRAPEIGIRLALGARRASIVSLVVGDGMRLVAIGLTLGLAAALAGARLVRSQLFGISATDPLTFAAVCVALALVGLAACAVPASRATRVDPAVVLRNP
jgi:predicted permease